ncbi:MAG: ATP-binding protein, partial [Chloroflexota bacterium]
MKNKSGVKKLPKRLRLRLNSIGLKLFLSYLAVIAVGTLILLWAVDLVATDSFTSRMRQMRGPNAGAGSGFGRGPGAGGGQGLLDPNVEQAFRAALSDALWLAGAVALIAAIAMSLLITRQLVRLVRRMSAASHRIASGHYSERVATHSQDELGELAKSFNLMAGALQATEQRRLDLLGDVAHELRTPIATLEGYLEGLLDGVIEPSERTWAKLHGEAGRLRHLVDDLQELSRAEAHQIPLHLARINPLEVAHTAIDRLALQFAETSLRRELELQTNLPDSLPPVRADPDRAVQVLTNLLTNALRYTPAPGKVQLTVGLTEGAVEYSVTDSGMGIAPENLPHLFERFYRVDKSRSRTLGGSG